MLVDEFAEFINSLPGLFGEIHLEEIEITGGPCTQETDMAVYIPKDKLEEFLQSLRDMQDHEK